MSGRRSIIVSNAFMLVICPALIMAAEAEQEHEVQTVPYVDLERYMGTWYEIARLPNRFQRDCVGATAEYTLVGDKKVRVVNTCYTADGRSRAVEGEAEVAGETNARLKVKFNNWFFKLFSWLVKGDYWIIDLAEDYSTAVVGTPNRKYLWILHRERELGEELYQSLLRKIEAMGFEVEKIIETGVPD